MTVCACLLHCRIFKRRHYKKTYNCVRMPTSLCTEYWLGELMLVHFWSACVCFGSLCQFTLLALHVPFDALHVTCGALQAVLDEQLSQLQESSGAHLRMSHMSVIPDALYMVEDKEYAASLPRPAHIPSSSSTVDIIAGTVPGEGSTSH